jgi:hypothetical protein
MLQSSPNSFQHWFIISESVVNVIFYIFGVQEIILSQFEELRIIVALTIRALLRIRPLWDFDAFFINFWQSDLIV